MKERFEYKGNVLGRTMFYPFIESRQREVDGVRWPIQTNSPLTNEFIKALGQAPWLEHARVVYVATTVNGKPELETIANIPIRLNRYGFIDGRLFEILLSVDAKQGGKVAEGLLTKYGPPTTEENDVYTWDRGETQLIVKELDVGDAGRILVVKYVDTILAAEVERRRLEIQAKDF